MLASSIFSQRRMFETRKKKKKGNQRPCWFRSNMPSPPSPLENLFPFFFLMKRYLYYTKRRTNTKRSPYRNLLDANRRDSCTHKLTQKTLKEKKITTESLGSLVLVETAVRLHRRHSPRPRRTLSPKKNNRTPKASRSSIARRR